MTFAGGFTAQDLYEAGYSARELHMDGGFTARELQVETEGRFIT